MVDIAAPPWGGWVTRFVLLGTVLAATVTAIIGLSVLRLADEV